MVVIRLARGGAKKRPSTTSLQPIRVIVAMAVSSSASVSTTQWLPVVKLLCASPKTVWLTGNRLAHNCRHRCSSGSSEQSSLILVTGLTDKNASGVQVPDDLAQVGFVFGAYGVAGWVRIRPFSEDADALLKVKTWWLDKPACHDVDVKQANCMAAMSWRAWSALRTGTLLKHSRVLLCHSAKPLPGLVRR
jgi:hypothetical protein